MTQIGKALFAVVIVIILYSFFTVIEANASELPIVKIEKEGQTTMVIDTDDTLLFHIKYVTNITMKHGIYTFYTSDKVYKLRQVNGRLELLTKRNLSNKKVWKGKKL